MISAALTVDMAQYGPKLSRLKMPATLQAAQFPLTKMSGLPYPPL